jgi:hypothetical protein
LIFQAEGARRNLAGPQKLLPDNSAYHRNKNDKYSFSSQHTPCSKVIGSRRPDYPDKVRPSRVKLTRSAR